MDPVKVMIEIPEGSRVKYELDEETGQMTVDRIMPTAMGYPTTYGLVLDTHGQDGDALDALVFLSQPVVPGVTIKCNIIGVLEMEDEEGIDHKLLAVPVAKVDHQMSTWTDIESIPEARKIQIRHFFEHYKDLEPGKWVKLKDWQNKQVAYKILEAGQKRHHK